MFLGLIYAIFAPFLSFLSQKWHFKNAIKYLEHPGAPYFFDILVGNGT